MWTLDNGEERNANNPNSFEIPEEWERKSLTKGDLAKLIFLTDDGGERMWVEIKEVVGGDAYIGALVNHPVVIEGLEYGDFVAFHARHVIDVRIRNAS